MVAAQAEEKSADAWGRATVKLIEGALIASGATIHNVVKRTGPWVAVTRDRRRR